jgi:macrolide transport system ATP-binding/permease protein
VGTVSSGHFADRSDGVTGKNVMRLANIFRLRLRSLFARAVVEQELDEELRYHLERQVEENLAAGMSREDAQRAAPQSIHGFEQRKEECRDMRGLNLIDNLVQDVRFAIRQLRKNPGFTSTAILMLALGMSASVAIFAFVDAALIKPLPYRNPGRLVGVFETAATCPRCNVSFLNFRDWRKSGEFFSSLDVWGFRTYLLRTPTGAQPAPGTRVSDGFFRTLGVTPILGRDFYAGEDAPGAAHTVLLSFAAWQNRFGGNPNVVGQAVTLSDVSYTVIGVLPHDFQFAPRGTAEFWAPLNDHEFLGGCEKRRGCHNLFAVARLKDGVSAQSALAGMQSIAQQMANQYPDSNRGFGADVVALSEVVSGDIRPILLLLLSGAGLLLLIACVNVSSLLVVRSESRRREVAVRSALGASQGRITRQFVTEGLVLVAAGSALGLAFAYWTMHLLAALIPADKMGGMPFLHDLGFNAGVLTFAGAISLLAAVLFSLTPALRLSLPEMQAGLAEGSRGSAGTLWRRLGSKLVVLELATALVLLVGAGLLDKSLYRLLHVDIGLQPDHLATLQVTLPNTNLTTERLIPLERQMISRTGSLPGVKSAGISTSLPLSSWSLSTSIRVSGRPSNGERNDVPERAVSSGYLKTLEAKLLRGRYFTEVEDDPAKPRVVLINQTFAKKYFPGEDPIGRQLAYETSHDRMEIIGIIEDIKEGQLDTANRATMYVPFTQDWFSSFGLVVRTSQGEQTLLPALIATLHQIDPAIATEDAATMNDVIDDSQSAYLHRSSAWLVGGFAALALVLGVVGLYGVIAYSVSQRTREVGIRMALGADRISVYRLILKEAVWLTAAGIAIGLACSLAAGTLMHGLLFGVRSWDVPTLAAVAGVLGGAALLASYIPARRAAAINPVEALRAE